MIMMPDTAGYPFTPRRLQDTTLCIQAEFGWYNVASTSLWGRNHTCVQVAWLAPVL